MAGMPVNFDLNDLQAFRAVADLGSFRKAAEAVNISQPAFSRRIDKLEDALGVKLLDRTTRRVALTAVGGDFAHKVRRLLDDLDDTLLGIRDVAANRMGEVTVAGVPSTVYYFLSGVIRRYHERYPRIRVKIHDGNASEVLAAVVQGQADFGLNFIGAQEPEIEFRPLLEERFVAACHRDHPLAGRASTTWRELAQHDFIGVSRSSGNRLLIDQALARSAVRPQSICEAEHVTTLLGLVEAGLGVAAVPALAMPAGDHPLLVSIPLGDPVVTRRIGVISRKGRSLSPAAQQLYELVCEPPEQGVRRAPAPRPRRVKAGG